MKKNCWETLRCGNKECPAVLEERLNGVHGGLNAGRACWVVAGTRCKTGVSGTFAEKIGDCKKCRFYQLVVKEEGIMFQSTLSLLATIQDDIKGETETQAAETDEYARRVFFKFKAGASGMRDDII